MQDQLASRVVARCNLFPEAPSWAGILCSRHRLSFFLNMKTLHAYFLSFIVLWSIYTASQVFSTARVEIMCGWFIPAFLGVLVLLQYFFLYMSKKMFVSFFSAAVSTGAAGLSKVKYMIASSETSVVIDTGWARIVKFVWSESELNLILKKFEKKENVYLTREETEDILRSASNPEQLKILFEEKLRSEPASNMSPDIFTALLEVIEHMADYSGLIFTSVVLISGLYGLLAGSGGISVSSTGPAEDVSSLGIGDSIYSLRSELSNLSTDQETLRVSVLMAFGALIRSLSVYGVDIADSMHAALFRIIPKKPKPSYTTPTLDEIREKRSSFLASVLADIDGESK